jgi:hypothetical protein
MVGGLLALSVVVLRVRALWVGILLRTWWDRTCAARIVRVSVFHLDGTRRRQLRRLLELCYWRIDDTGARVVVLLVLHSAREQSLRRDHQSTR